MSEHLWGGVDERTRRMTCGLAGGVGGTHQELCGTLSGGAMIIGALHGRTDVDEEDTVCYRLVSLYRDRFLERFRTTRCQDLRDSGYGSEGQWPCSELVYQATLILWDVLSE